MSLLNRRINRGVRTIETTQIAMTELVWADGGRTFEAYLPDGTNLTADGGFDDTPDDVQLRHLLHTRRGSWCCPGCRRHLDDTQTDMVADHLQDCDRYDDVGHSAICTTSADTGQA